MNVKRYILIVGVASACLIPALSCAEAPHQIAGLVLGEHIESYTDKVTMSSSLPIRHMEYVHEVEAQEIEGFKSGLIWYGTCAKPGRIVRIMLKYRDSSKKFYDALLKHYKNRFGEPDEWRGDPFKIVITWKWSFIDAANNKISLLLQHNTKDEEERIGNSVKLTATNFIDEERDCFSKNHPTSVMGQGNAQPRSVKQNSINWDLIIPR